MQQVSSFTTFNLRTTLAPVIVTQVVRVAFLHQLLNYIVETIIELFSYDICVSSGR